jgi:hypothetical protein
MPGHCCITPWLGVRSCKITKHTPVLLQIPMGAELRTGPDLQIILQM